MQLLLQQQFINYACWPKFNHVIKNIHTSPRPVSPSEQYEFVMALLIVNECYIDFHEYERHIFCVLVCSSPSSDDTLFWQRAIILACESNESLIFAERYLGAQLEKQGENIFKTYKRLLLINAFNREFANNMKRKKKIEKTKKKRLNQRQFLFSFTLIMMSFLKSVASTWKYVLHRHALYFITVMDVVNS